MYESFQITQNIILVNDQRAILILRHRESKKWLLPGGRIEKGEMWESALKREIREEIGIENISIQEIFDVDSWKSKDIPYYGITFYGIFPAETITLSSEHDKWKFVTEENLDSVDFWNKRIHQRIAKFFQSKKYEILNSKVCMRSA